MAILRPGMARRGAIQAFLRFSIPGVAFIFLGGADDVPPGYYADQKVVYQNDGRPEDQIGYFRQQLANLQNHINAVGREHLVLRVVSFASGIDLFVIANSDTVVADTLDRLRRQGVVFLICRNTLKARGIDWRTLYGVVESDVVPSGVAEIARLEGMGFAYVHP